jgi:hypothetical protein
MGVDILCCSLACLSSPLVLALQVQARCLQPPGLTARTGKLSLGLYLPGTQLAAAILPLESIPDVITG